MCISSYIAKFCSEQVIPYDDITVELSRRIKTLPSSNAASPAKTSLTARTDAKIRLGAKLSQKQQRGILEAADSCHITQSIKQGMQIVCTLVNVK